MRAQVLVQAGKEFKLQLEQLRMPTPGDGEVLIRTKASDANSRSRRRCGRCSRDNVAAGSLTAILVLSACV
jgi:D-arabinose 1-dehydrogenase-like Zn-dependent alcohol dehydrogenase